jgi:hypothetical protein
MTVHAKLRHVVIAGKALQISGVGAVPQCDISQPAAVIVMHH